MEPPSKRPRLDCHDVSDEEEDQDELSMDPAQFDATQDPMYQLDKGRAKAATRLKSAFEDIFEKYSQDFSGGDDVINFYTDEIEVDNGHVQSLMKKEKKKKTTDGATYGSDSSDEEERILSGKPGGRGDKSPSKPKSLIPANHTQPTKKTPRPQSQWNGFPGLGTYRLSSLSFASSPYGPPPPFEFAYGSDHVDPVWQAPDLPLQLPHNQRRSLTGAWGSQFGSFGEQLRPAAKRIVTAKSFLLHAASTSPKTSDDDMEEDDTSPNNLDSMGKEVAQAKTTEVPTTGIASAQHHKPAESPRARSPRVHKWKQPKKSDARESGMALDTEPEREPHSLRPNERRIEIIIPIMKHLPPTEPRPDADETERVVGGSPPELEIEGGRLPVNRDPGDTHSKNEQHILRSTHPPKDQALDKEPANLANSSRRTNVKHMAQVVEDLEHASTLSRTQSKRRRRSGRNLAPTELSSKDVSAHDEQCTEHACAETTWEPKSPQMATDNVATDAACISLYEIEKQSHCDSQSDGVVSSPPLSPVLDTDVDETKTTHITNMEGVQGESVKEALVDGHSPEEVSVQSVLPTEELRERSVDGIVEALDSTTTEADIPEAAISQELEAMPYDNEASLQDELDCQLVNNREQGISSIYSHAPDKTTAHHPNLHSDDVFSSSTQDTQITIPSPIIEPQSPKYSASRETVESELYTDQDYLPPVLKATQRREREEHDASHQPLLSSELVAEIDGLQLGSDYRDTQQSPSPEALELPDEDLSIFPPSYDAHPISELVLRLSASTKQTDTQHDVGAGRSPSPELGTPTGPEIIQRTATPTKSTRTPTTPTKSRGPRSTKPRSSHHHTPSSQHSTLSSFIPQDIDDESDDELSMAGSFSSTRSRFYSPFSRANPDDSPILPPLFSTPRKRNRKSSLLTSSPSSARTPENQSLGSHRDKNMPPATDSRASRGQSRRGRPRAAHSSPLARTVAERLLSSPTKKHRAAPAMSPGLVLSPRGTLRRCGEDGFACERAFCLTCCK
ncbi:hypothetical protein F5X97DRAFT_150858 [Nemania serpens]|nr:hypothetical protein F5X97DRAFT_150858 [Nemania serpens]